MEQSILKSTKKLLNVSLDDPTFDLDIVTHINSEFSILHDLGVGPQEGFVIEDDTTEWNAYLPTVENLVDQAKVKTCVWLRARLLFDPPTSAFLLEAVKAQLQEHEWRLSVEREGKDWFDPNPPVLVEEDDTGFGL